MSGDFTEAVIEQAALSWGSRRHKDLSGLRGFAWVIFGTFDHGGDGPPQTDEACRRVEVRNKG